MKNSIVFILLLILCGCNRTDTESACVETGMAGLVSENGRRIQDGRLSVRQATDALILLVGAETNAVSRAGMICKWVNELSNLDISGLPFETQRMIIHEVCEVCIFKDGIIHKAAKLTGSIETAYAEQVKVLAWLRKQIERLRPRRKINFKEMSSKEQREYSEWRNCYMTAVVEYVQSIRRIEKIELPDVKEMLSSVDYQRIKNMIEGALGRDVCCDIEGAVPKENAMLDFDFDAVVRREIGPKEDE